MFGLGEVGGGTGVLGRGSLLRPYLISANLDLPGTQLNCISRNTLARTKTNRLKWKKRKHFTRYKHFKYSVRIKYKSNFS